MKRMTILRDVEEKLLKYDKAPKGNKYNECYRSLLKARPKKPCLVQENGSVGPRPLKKVERTLRCFEMGRFGQMDETFLPLLKAKLEREDLRSCLSKFAPHRIESQGWTELEKETRAVYNTLAEGGENGLSARDNRFDVGATKLMNFLFPELFVMLDKNVAEALISNELVHIRRKGSTYDFSFESLWDTMRICNREIELWKKQGESIQSLLDLDGQPTTLPRIFDKCAFITGKYEQ